MHMHSSFCLDMPVSIRRDQVLFAHDIVPSSMIECEDYCEQHVYVIVIRMNLRNKQMPA